MLRLTLRCAFVSALTLFAAPSVAQIDVTRLAREQPSLLAQLERLPHSSVLVRDSRLTWSAPRRLLMDQARRWIGLDALSEQMSAAGSPTLTGQGVVVGIVDGGIDFTHPDFQDATGATRIAWLIDFGLPPLGIHPELEREYGCDADEGFQCGILSASELDAIIDGERVNNADGLQVNPVADRVGHGTHVASLAAGSGQSDARYRGVAPEATLIVASASDELSVSDAVVLLASRFIFERAAELAMPAVVNLSLGGNFGPHDGSSAVESALAELVEPKGRALVVAAGNSGVLYQGEFSGYDGPFGIHTEVHLSNAGSARVPILIPPAAGESALLVWIEGPRDDRFRIGLEAGNGDTLVPPIEPGRAVGSRDEGREILLINHVFAPELEGGEDFVEGAVIVISGDFSDVDLYALRLEGQGNAHLWLESLGAIGPDAGLQGAIFPRATRAGTITLPATSPRVIAVGATVNRNTWPSRDDGKVELAEFGLARFRLPDTPAFFSSEGPNLNGLLKPDILAPGFAVIGAMGAPADPIANGLPNALSMFAFSPVCSASSTCSVVDDEHGVAVGTSMSSPIVAGAVALLLQRAPESSQDELLGLLQAGSRKLDDTSERANPGSLDIKTSLSALDVRDGAMAPAPDTGSFLSLAAAFAYPDPELSLTAHLHLRAGIKLADADLEQISIQLEHGALRAQPRRLAPGLIAFTFSANHASAEQALHIRALFEGKLLTERELPIAMDTNVARSGGSVRGGCNLVQVEAARHDLRLGGWAMFQLLALCLLRRRGRFGGLWG